MIRHIVLFRFLDQAQGRTKEENLQLAKEKMTALPQEIPQIRHMEVRFAHPGQAPANFDYILLSDFDSLEDLAVYQKHPAHVAFGQFISQLRHPDGRVCIDYQL